MEAEQCPVCGGPLVLPGVVRSRGEAAATQFVPNHVRYLRFWSDGVPLQGGAVFRCCTSCGHVWASLKTEDLRAFVMSHCNELVKQVLAREGAEVWHDQPDHPDARRAAEAVAEIDALALSGKASEVTRRFRDLTGRTWDEAIEATHKWWSKTRAEKLTLFGWQSKASPGDGKDPTAQHPLHDPQIDG